MKRRIFLCLIGGLAIASSLGVDGCLVVPIELGPPSPAIIPTNPDEESLLRSFTVDLRDYPQTAVLNWEFGDGTMVANLPLASGRAVTHEFSRAGTFVVSVHLFTAKDWVDARGSSLIASGSLPIEVVAPNKLPTAVFVVEDVVDENQELVGLAKRFSASGSSDRDGTIESYRWDFGDGSTATGETIEHTYKKSGRYVVRLTVKDDRGGKDSTTRTVLANTLPIASFTYRVDPNDALMFTFDASGSTDGDGVIVEYRWDFGDETVEGTGQIVTHRYVVPDDYTVVLTVVDDFGVTVSMSQLVNVTGSEPFVRSISPDTAEVDTVVSGAVIDGENFEVGLSVRLVRGATTISATAVTVESETTIQADFDLSGAELGDYTVVVENPDTTTAELLDGFRVVTPNLVRFTTSMGDMLFELVDDAPITTENFLQYVEDGFYDGTIFQRVVLDFVVQGGGVLPDGSTPEGLRDPIQNEFSQDRSNVRGTVAMAKVGGDPDSATSQFFVNLADNSENLDNQNGGFTVFANVIEGMDVADAISLVEVDGNDRPLEDVLLIKAERE
ncbi:MAG: PKD domain-containing protein [Planctomycetota bacterium]